MSAQPLSVGCLIFDRMDQIDFTGPFEVLSRMPDTTVQIVAKEADLFAFGPECRSRSLRNQRSPSAESSVFTVWIDFPTRDSAFTMTRMGKGDRFAIAAKTHPEVLLGYVFSNGNGTWSVERDGKKLPEGYATIGEAAKAL